MVVRRMTKREKDIESFYDLLLELEKHVGGKRRLDEFLTGIAPPVKGVYFFFEPGEYRSNDSAELRVVRVGTHGSSERSSSTIWTRMFEHKMDNGRSVFRDHVYWALRNKAKFEQRTPCGDQEHQQCVSAYIGRMPFLWLKVDSHHERQFIESNAVAMLSNFRCRDNPIDRQSDNWLGRFRFDPEYEYRTKQIRENRKKVAKSGLWNVDYVSRRSYSPKLLEKVRALIDSTPKIANSSAPCMEPSD